jgi:hypothetical protein
MDVCCVLSDRGLCNELITRSEESHRLWRVVVCDYKTSWYEEAIARAGLQSQRNKQQKCMLNTFISGSSFNVNPGKFERLEKKEFVLLINFYLSQITNLKKDMLYCELY